jgi:hypothetical protein
LRKTCFPGDGSDFADKSASLALPLQGLRFDRLIPPHGVDASPIAIGGIEFRLPPVHPARPSDQRSGLASESSFPIGTAEAAL